MITAADILAFMESIAPKYMLMEWDNAGLLCGRSDKEIRKILVALDPFYTVCREAIEIGANMIITHHPLIFGGQTAVNDSTETGRSLLALIEHGICAINAHTNLDVAPGGINDILASTLGLKDIQVIKPTGTDAQGRPYGLLRCGDVEQQSLESFLSYVKRALGAEGLRYVDGGKPVKKVAVGGGTCGEGMYDALEAGCDTFVTADIKYHQFHDAYDRGLNIIDAGHLHTENPTMPILAQKLRTEFPEIEVIFSENHRDPMKFFI